jgi:hypothetical protein
MHNEMRNAQGRLARRGKVKAERKASVKANGSRVAAGESKAEEAKGMQTGGAFTVRFKKNIYIYTYSQSHRIWTISPSHHPPSYHLTISPSHHPPSYHLTISPSHHLTIHHLTTSPSHHLTPPIIALNPGAREENEPRYHTNGYPKHRPFSREQ